MLLNPNQLNRLKDESNSNYDSFRRNWSITGFVQQKLNEMNSVYFILNFLYYFIEF